MKSGDAVFLHLAATIAEPVHDITLVMYDCEEIEATANGLGRIERELPDWLRRRRRDPGRAVRRLHRGRLSGHHARGRSRRPGTRAHSARSWLGDNAIHKLGAVLDRLAAYEARIVDIDGCTYREGLSAVRIDGGVAGNVIPDAASVTVNFRFAPDRSAAGGAGARARGVRRTGRRRGADRRGRRRAARPAAPGRRGAGGGCRRAGARQVRLDRRGAVRGAGHSGGQLRSR